MRAFRSAGWVLAAGVLATPDTRAAERAVAVTFDNLPAPPAAVVSNDVPSLSDLTQRLLASVLRYGVPAVGFVNEGKLFLEGGGPRAAAGRTQLLEMWLDAGLELGNHRFSHHELNRTPLEQFEAAVRRGELVTRRLLQGRGSSGISVIPSSNGRTSTSACSSASTPKEQPVHKVLIPQARGAWSPSPERTATPRPRLLSSYIRPDSIDNSTPAGQRQGVPPGPCAS